MKSTIALVVSLLTLAAPAFAQSAATLKRELRSKESVAKKEKTAEALCEVAMWASDKGLASDAKRLFLAVLKMDPAHEAANLGLGNAMFDGKWMRRKKADGLRKKAMDAEFKAKGYVKVESVWVAPDNVDDAKRGVFHHEGDLVTIEEKQALLRGMVRHPDTGLLIEAKNAAKAAKHTYPVGREGRWADEKTANTYYSDLSHPWIVRTAQGTLVSTLEMARIQELKAHIDRGCKKVAPLCGGPPLPTHRPVIIIGATIDEMKGLGDAFGDETSAAPAFLMEEDAAYPMPFQGNVRAAVCDASNKGLAPYYTRHAAAMSYLHGKCSQAGANVPKWFQHAVGALASRFESDYDGAHFCRTAIVPKGGAKNLKGFLNGFTLNGDMAPLDISFNVSLAGLLIHFATQGGDPTVTDAMVAVTEGLKNGEKDAIEQGVEHLAVVLVEAEDKIIAHMQKLLDANR